MIPLFFGDRERRLFGVYSAASIATRKFPGKRAVVLCAPWGQEYLRSHRALRRLGVSLNAAGLDVLRFDYFGTGDSAGDMPDAVLRDWETDIGVAIDELCDMSEVTRVTLVGLRLGAVLAASVAASRPREVERLVLWDPIYSGQEYLDEILTSTPRLRTAGKGDGFEVQGFPLPARMADEMAALSLSALLTRVPAKTLLLFSETPTWTAAASLQSEVIESPIAWREERDYGAGAVPAALLARIVEWAQS